jgi:hypothetical protein
MYQCATGILACVDLRTISFQLPVTALAQQRFRSPNLGVQGFMVSLAARLIL